MIRKITISILAATLVMGSYSVSAQDSQASTQGTVVVEQTAWQSMQERILDLIHNLRNACIGCHLDKD